MPPKQRKRSTKKTQEEVPRKAYSYFRKGKKIKVGPGTTKVKKYATNPFITTRLVHGEQRWVKVLKKNGKTYMTMLTDRRKEQAVYTSDIMQKTNPHQKTMVKTIPPEMANSFKELAKNEREYSIAMDFERRDQVPQRVAAFQGGKAQTVKIEDFELYGHTHPDEVWVAPSLADIRNLKELEPEFLIAGDSGKMIIMTIEDPVRYHIWHSQFKNYLGGTNPIRQSRYNEIIKNDTRFSDLKPSDYYTLLGTKKGRDLFFNETGVRIYPYRKETTIELKDDPKYEKTMPSIPQPYLKKYHSEK